MALHGGAASHSGEPEAGKDISTIVAVDRDKNSQQAAKWAVDRLMARGSTLQLVHAAQLSQMKVEESKLYQELRSSEEEALALVEMEKTKCKAALEAAEAAQKIAELEAQKRLRAEWKAKREFEERRRASDTDLRYRRRGNTKPIPWNIRFRIAADIATGLLFLHQAKPEPLVHRDLKPGNILLDHNFVSKISDVGLARLVPQSIAEVTQYRMTSTAGTFCYIDPEYQQTGMLTTKSDIYSFGILLLQIITARSPMGLKHQVEHAIEKGAFQEALAFTQLALKCAELRKKDRPDLGKEILPELNRLRTLGQEYEAAQAMKRPT
uniref:RING-type E3 ubiquitin transferase n=1 Tax=Aegilops tauschii TaxID=37682 RepID=N1R4N2_AEGTA